MSMLPPWRRGVPGMRSPRHNPFGYGPMAVGPFPAPSNGPPVPLGAPEPFLDDMDVLDDADDDARAEEREMRKFEEQCSKREEAAQRAWFQRTGAEQRRSDFANLDFYIKHINHKVGTERDVMIRFMFNVARKYAIDLLEYAQSKHGVDLKSELESNRRVPELADAEILDRQIQEEEDKIRLFQQDLAGLGWRDWSIKRSLRRFIQDTEQHLARLKEKRAWLR